MTWIEFKTVVEDGLRAQECPDIDAVEIDFIDISTIYDGLEVDYNKKHNEVSIY